MRFKLMTAVACALLTVPAFAQNADPAASTPEKPAPEKPKKEKKVCRMDPESTGSRLSTSTCHTPSQWAKIDASGINENATPGVRSSSGEGASSGR